MIRRLLIAVAVLAVASAAATTTAASSSADQPVLHAAALPVFETFCLKPSVRPRQIMIACADGGEVLEHLRWSRWTATRAVGTGTLEVNDCTPNCAAGRFVATAVHVVASDARRCSGTSRARFLHLRITKASTGKPADPSNDDVTCSDHPF